MLSFQEFLTKYNGQAKVGNTPENTGECTGLVNVWVENLGLPHLWGNGKDIFSLADERYYEKILNTPDAVPQQGDIISWKYGTFGHTAIATGGAGTDIHKFEVFEQNVPLGGSCRLHLYDNEYQDVIGWVRPKSTLLDSQKIIIQQSDAFIAVCTKLNLPANRDIVLADLDKLVQMQDAVIQKDKQIADAQTQIASLQKDVADKATQYDSLHTTVNNLTEELAVAKAENDDHAKQLEDLQKTCQQTPVFTGWKKIVYDILKSL